MRNLCLSVLIVFASLTFSVAQSDKDFIHWKEDIKLSWSDFKGKPIKTSSYHAQTQGSLNYTFDNDGPGAYIFNLNVKFDKKKSWVKSEEATDNLLNHERGHFDIYEIYGRTIIKRIKETKALTGLKFSENIEKIFRKSFDELQKFQQEYDDETNHSKILEKQEEWNEKLQDLLKELEDHKVKEIPFKVTN